MKFEDINVGMKVRDHLGNEYEVVDVEEKRDAFPVQLCCTKLVQAVQVENGTVFDSVDATWWVCGNREYILDASDSVVQQIMRGLGANPEYAQNKTIWINTLCGEPQNFYVYPESRLADFELTCDELSLISQVELVVADKAVVSTDSLKLGMKLQHADGMYIVIGFDDQYVHMGAVVDATTCDGVTHKAAMCIQIPVEAPEGQLSLKDFTVAED